MISQISQAVLLPHLKNTMKRVSFYQNKNTMKMFKKQLSFLIEKSIRKGALNGVNNAREKVSQS